MIELKTGRKSTEAPNLHNGNQQRQSPTTRGFLDKTKSTLEKKLKRASWSPDKSPILDLGLEIANFGIRMFLKILSGNSSSRKVWKLLALILELKFGQWYFLMLINAFTMRYKMKLVLIPPTDIIWWFLSKQRSPWKAKISCRCPWYVSCCWCLFRKISIIFSECCFLFIHVTLSEILRRNIKFRSSRRKPFFVGVTHYVNFMIQRFYSSSPFTLDHFGENHCTSQT